MSDLLERLSLGPLFGDIPMRLVLPTEGQTSCPEALSILTPERVLAAHREAVEAGAGVIRTNTYAANLTNLSACGMGDRANEINWTAVQIAREAVKDSQCLVAGSIGPIPEGDEALLKNQMGALLDGGVDLLVFEDFRDVELLLRALHFKQELHHLPGVCFLPSDSPTPEDDLARLAEAGAEVLGAYCALAGSSNPFEGMHFPDQFLAVATGHDASLQATVPTTGEEVPKAGAFSKACAHLSEHGVRLFFAGPGVGLKGVQEASSFFT